MTSHEYGGNQTDIDQNTEKQERSPEALEVIAQVLSDHESRLERIERQSHSATSAGNNALSEPESVQNNADREDGGEVGQKPDTVRDLERLSKITGRAVDDPDLIKLHLKLKLDQFKLLSDSYANQEGSVRQESFMQDMATAKRELEEAMYQYDPKFAEMDSRRQRIINQLGRVTDPQERSKLRQELMRLKDHGYTANINTEEIAQIDEELKSVSDSENRERLKLRRSELEKAGKREPRRHLADSLTERLDDIASSVNAELLATYELHKGEYPADPISTRRRTDTVDWRGKPEYDSRGVYIGLSPARNDGEWILEPKAPLEIDQQIESSYDESQSSDNSLDNPEDEGANLSEPNSEDSSNTEPELDIPPLMPKIEVPPINLGNYPELYAKRKNLVGGDVELLESEAKRLSESITANINAQVNNFIAENPSATPEEIRAFTLNCYVDSQNQVQEAVIAAIDGRGYKDAEGNEKGKSRLRRFGAWLDKHGSKLKKGLLVAGAAGAVALTGGVLAGAIVPAFALGTGTVIGAIKGTMVGLGMSRHGSKESASRDIGADGIKDKFEQMSQEDTIKFAEISTYLMDQYNSAADKDHKLNVKKSRRAAVVGAVLGGLTGSLSFDSPNTVEVSQTIEVANQPPELPSHTIQPGELTGHIIQKTLHELGLSEGDRFVMPDGSTNLDAIYEYFTPEEWQNNSAFADGTHSVEGANSLSNEGIRHIIQTIVDSKDWGSHTEVVESTMTEMNRNWLATIGGWVAGGLLTAATARQIADLAKKSKDKKSPDINNTGVSGAGKSRESENNTYEYTESAKELEPGKVYGFVRYYESNGGNNPKPVKFKGMEGDQYVFRDLESNKEIKYTPNQMEGDNGWVKSGRFKKVRD